MKKFVVGIIGGCLLGAGAGQADERAPSEKYLQVHEFDNIPYLSGGVGIDERARLQALAAHDNLALSFSLIDGHYLRGADVSIKDRSGKEILDAAADGPLFFAKLPAGRYTVKATAMGKTISRTVTIPANGQAHVFFAWAGSDHDRTMS